MDATDHLLEFQRYMSKKIGGRNKFEKHCGISTGCLNNAVKSKMITSMKTVIKVKEKFPELNMNWVVNGEGNMILSGINSCNMDYKEAYEECLKAIESLNDVIKAMNSINSINKKIPI